jgi:hypothetical protein
MARKTGKTKRPAVKRTQKRSLSQRAVKAALGRFTRRVTDLVLAYAKAGKLKPQLSRAALQLIADIQSWGEGSGHKDIRATDSALTKPPDDSWTCDNCDVIMVSRGRLCFLVGCDPAYRNCSYVCIVLPTNHVSRR